jgi:hypothetical protein
MWALDLINLHFADGRECILAKGIDPLRRMLPIPPAGLVLSANGLRSVGKSWNSGLGSPLLYKRIAAFTSAFSIAERLFSRLGQRDQAGSSESNVASATLDDRSQHPPLCAGWIDDQIKAISIGVSARPFERSDLERGESFLRMLPSLRHASA